MQFPDKANANRQLSKLGYPVLQSNDIVADFVQVVSAAFHSQTSFSSQQFAESGLSAFDFAG
ncbi:MAG TPA: hypothetical protein VFB72_03645 [Verrucomicrobiae bacterium]|nr:hypothetical protein [Verrucomicrobiae bacterium]